MAIHRWLASGAYQRMERDIHDLQGGSSWEQAVWTPKRLRGNVSLTLNHILPPIGILVFGLIPSAIIFFLELLHNLYNKRATRGVSSVTHVEEIVERENVLEMVPEPFQHLEDNPDIILPLQDTKVGGKGYKKTGQEERNPKVAW